MRAFAQGKVGLEKDLLACAAHREKDVAAGASTDPGSELVLAEHPESLGQRELPLQLDSTSLTLRYLVRSAVLEVRRSSAI